MGAVPSEVLMCHWCLGEEHRAKKCKKKNHFLGGHVQNPQTGQFEISEDIVICRFLYRHLSFFVHSLQWTHGCNPIWGLYVSLVVWGRASSQKEKSQLFRWPCTKPTNKAVCDFKRCRHLSFFVVYFMKLILISMQWMCLLTVSSLYCPWFVFHFSRQLFLLNISLLSFLSVLFYGLSTDRPGSQKNL